MRFLILLPLLVHIAIGYHDDFSDDLCSINTSELEPQSFSHDDYDALSTITSTTEGCFIGKLYSLHCDFKNDDTKYTLDESTDFKHIEISNTQNLTVLYTTCKTTSYDFKNVTGITFHPLVESDYCCSPIHINANNSVFDSVTLFVKTTMDSSEVNVTKLVAMDKFDFNGTGSTKIDQITLGAEDRRGSLKSVDIGILNEITHFFKDSLFSKFPKVIDLEMTDVQVDQMTYEVSNPYTLLLTNSVIYKSNITIYERARLTLNNSLIMTGNVEMDSGSFFEVNGDISGPKYSAPVSLARNRWDLGNGLPQNINSLDQLPDNIRWYSKSNYKIYAPDYFQLKQNISSPLPSDYTKLSKEEIGQLCTLDASQMLTCDLSTIENQKTKIDAEDILPLIGNSTGIVLVRFTNANEILFIHNRKFSELMCAFLNIQKLYLEIDWNLEREYEDAFSVLFISNTTIPFIEGYINHLFIVNNSTVGVFKHTATNHTEISNSQVNSLSLETQSFKFNNSEIKSIDKLFMNGTGSITNCNISNIISVFGTETSHLDISNVRIKEIKREGLILLNTFVINNSTINKLVDDSVLFDDLNKSTMEHVNIVSSGRNPFKFLNLVNKWKSVFIHDELFNVLDFLVPQKDGKDVKIENKVATFIVIKYTLVMFVFMLGILTSVYITCKLFYIVYCMFKPVTYEYFRPMGYDRR